MELKFKPKQMQEFTHLKKSSIYKIIKLIKDGNEEQLYSKQFPGPKLKEAALLNKYRGLVEFLVPFLNKQSLEE
jgi:hypothetical protein